MRRVLPLRHRLFSEEVSGSGRGATGEAQSRRQEIVRRLLGEATSDRRREVARWARLPFVTARRVWQALGLPELGEREMPFTRSDLDVLPDIAHLRRVAGMDDELVLGFVRAFARSTDRLAAWQAGLVMESVAARREGAGDAHSIWTEQLDAEERRTVVERMLDMADALEPVLVYSWRRHLASTLGQLVDGDDDEIEGEAGSNTRTVGFADLVDFTSTVDGMSERQLSSMVGDFEGLAADVVTVHGGRVVKTIGDEVLFSCERTAAAGAIGLDLIEALRGIPDMPTLRVGISTGPVVTQFGDVFGTTVNRASRLTDVAVPGTVVVDAATQRRLSNISGFELLSLEDMPLRGLGVTELWELRRASRPTRRGPTAYYPPQQ